MKLNPFAMWTFSKKFAKKNNWFGQELRNLYKFKVFIMNQSTTPISRTAARLSVCAATHAMMPLGPTCRRQKGFSFWRETSAVSPPNSQQLSPHQSHWHIGPSSQGPQASDVTPHGTRFDDQERHLLHVRMRLWDCQAGPTLSMSCALSCSLTFMFFLDS